MTILKFVGIYFIKNADEPKCIHEGYPAIEKLKLGRMIRFLTERFVLNHIITTDVNLKYVL